MPAAALCLLLAGGAFAAPKADPDRDSISRAREELKDSRKQIDASMADLRPDLDRMPRLEMEFDSAQDFDAIFMLERTESQPFRVRIRRFGRLRGKYLAAKSRIAHLQGALFSKGAGDSVPDVASEIIADEGYWDRTQAFALRLAAAERGVVEKRNAAENRVWAAEGRRLKEAVLRLGLTLAVCALAPLAALAAGLLLWRRKASRLKTGPGKVFGDSYRVERELGRGSLGVVYEAVDLSLGRKVAIKRLVDSTSKDPASVQAVLRQAQAAAALKHPNIASLYTVLREEDRVYLISERLQGSTLAEELSGRKRLPLRTAKGIVRQVCSALEHAHERRVLHRGLKPGDIMLLPDGAVKVMDFGIARAVPPYIAPEQSSGGASKAADLYALGACAREMLAGQLPSPELEGFLRRALNAQAGLRFPSAAEFAAAFEALPEG